MKKLFSILLTFITLFHLVALPSLASPNKQALPTENTSEEKFISAKEELDAQPTDSEAISMPPVIPIEQRMSIRENGASFVQKIAAETLAIDGTLVENDGNALTINQALHEYKLDRFSLTDLAYQKGILTEEQRIESFCQLLIQRRFET